MLFHRIPEYLGILEGIPAHLQVPPPPKAGSLEHIAQEHVQGGVGCLQGGRLHELPGQPIGIIRGLY